MRGGGVGWVLALTIASANTVSAGIDEWTSLGPDGGSITALVVDPQNAGRSCISTPPATQATTR